MNARGSYNCNQFPASAGGREAADVGSGSGAGTLQPGVCHQMCHETVTSRT